MPAKTGKKQEKNLKKGQSGNPSGRPSGSRNKATIACQSLLDGDAEALTQKVVELALSGDMTALKICIERIIPPRKDSPIDIRLPKIEKPADLIKVTGYLTRAISTGKITPHEGEMISRALERYCKAIELLEIEARLAKLEQEIKR